MGSYTVAQFTKLAVALFQDATQVAAQATPQIAPQTASQGDTLARWQTIAFFIQAVAAVVIVVVTLRAARAGAERAYELGEQAARKRDEVEKKREEEKQKQQRDSLRRLLALEIRKNLIDLKWLLEKPMREVLSDASKTSTDKIREECLEVHALSLLVIYMPEWSHRAWYGQQSSPSLTFALDPDEILAVNFIHSEFDRLSQIKKLFSERMRQSDLSHGADREHTAQSPLSDAAAHLWSDFNDVVQDIIKIDKPLAGALKGAGIEYPTLSAEI